MKNQAPRQSNPHESGSALIWILIMVGLFGALSFALSQGSRQGMGTVGKEQAKLAASEFLTYSQKIKDAVKVVTIGNGCTETEISFENTISLTSYANPNSPSSKKKCWVFDTAGGGMRYEKASLKLLDSTLSASMNYAYPHFGAGYQIKGVGTEATDLIIQINFIHKDVCIAFNNLLGISNPNGIPPIENNEAATTTFGGNYGSPVADTIGDDGGHDLLGKQAYCRYNGSSYQFLQVLFTR